jgi:pSer/pThr/pTyr-binding forkhead associated (FHA) protein
MGMDFYLENLRTGEQFAVDPNRTLIGNAEHATIRTAESGPFLAALIVSYPTGWSVHGLTDDRVLFNGNPLCVTRQVTPQPDDVLEVDKERFRFVAVPDSAQDNYPPQEAETLPSCFAYIRFPDGMEECRVVDHNLLFGRLRACHVRYPDTKLSRLNALLAAHGNIWYVHSLTKNVIARNRQKVSGFAILEDGDELFIGPLVVRIEMRIQTAAESRELNEQLHSSQETVASVAEPQKTATSSSLTDAPTVETTLSSSEHNGEDLAPGVTAIYASGARLDQWLKAHSPESGSHHGLSSWFGAQRERLKRFWFDTPETTTARVLRNGGKPNEAFVVLDRALRARPDSPDLLRELYRLYDSIGLHDLCFRPLRQIEKLANAREAPDTWVLETLAKLCERLGRKKPIMFDRAMNYWTKLERATGVNYAREKAATMASRTLVVSGYAKMTEEDG